MKTKIKYILQKLLGIERYLYWFAKYKIKTLKNDSKESAFLQFLDLIKDQEGSILDVGANIGVMSYHAATRFPQKSIYAFEPMPLNLKILNKVKSKYKLSNLSIHAQALAQENKTLEMVLPKEQNVTLHGLAHVVHPSMEKFNKGDIFKMDAISLDFWMSENNMNALAGIKLDVENYELFVLNGASNTIRDSRPIILTELWDNQNRIDCFKHFEDNKYTAFIVRNQKVIKFDSTTHEEQNFIFVPQEKLNLVP